MIRVSVPLLLAFVLFATGLAPTAFGASNIDAIRTSALTKPGDYPLPLLSSWYSGPEKSGFNPDRQVRLIQQGHHILPWFGMPMPGEQRDFSYYRKALKYISANKLPFALLSTQWERLLGEQKKYVRAKISVNPNVVTDFGVNTERISPFGSEKMWQEVGEQWAASAVLKKLQQAYAHPPAVFFVSNNEHPKLNWHKAESSFRYVTQNSFGKSDAYKQKLFKDNWIKLYSALISGYRDGLVEGWKPVSSFMGYLAFGKSFAGKWDGWVEYSMASKCYDEPWIYSWDGASLEYYVNNWQDITDYTVWSPQIEAMNYKYMVNQTRKELPGFRIEMSVWDGYAAGKANDQRLAYRKSGQHYSPARYKSMVEFGMWLIRPAVVREFRFYHEKFASYRDYTMAALEAVDRVHSDATLTEFWKNGRVVPVPIKQHPYRRNVAKCVGERWFLLDCDANHFSGLKDEVKVYSIALELGTSPARQWLVYAYSPLSDALPCSVTVPGFGPLPIVSSVAGKFYLINESSRQVKEL